MQKLHALRGWPEGLWYRVDPSGQPRGALVWIHLQGSVLHMTRLDQAAEQNGTYCQILLHTEPVSRIVALPLQCFELRGNSLPVSAVMQPTTELHITSGNLA